MKRGVEVWVKGREMRSVDVTSQTSACSIRLLWSAVSEFVAPSFEAWATTLGAGSLERGLPQAVRTAIFADGAREQWRTGLSKASARKEIEGFRRRATKAGFVKLHSYTENL